MVITRGHAVECVGGEAIMLRSKNATLGSIRSDFFKDHEWWHLKMGDDTHYIKLSNITRIINEISTGEKRGQSEVGR